MRDKNNALPKTLQQAIRYFTNEQVCIDTIAALRWPDGPVCPKCGHGEHYYLATQKRWKCKACKKQFSVKVGTIFEDSPITLDKWLVALWMLVNCKNGISSYEVARGLGLTQKSAWFVLQRLRLALQSKSIVKLGGPGTEVEVDETFIGGAARFMHPTRRRRMITATGVKDKAAAFGILERGGKVRVFAVPNRKKKALQGAIAEHVEAGTSIYTDKHNTINHSREYAHGDVHTNTVESAFSLLKRGIVGSWHKVDAKHLPAYLDEMCFRFNNRKNRYLFRDTIVKLIQTPTLEYKELTARQAEPPAA